MSSKIKHSLFCLLCMMNKKVSFMIVSGI